MPAPKSKTEPNWIALSLPFFEEFQATTRSSRTAFLQRISDKVGKAPNTVYRQFQALAYLASKGVDLSQLALHYPPLMSVEAIARVGKEDPQQEADLLHRLLKGEGSVRSFRDAAMFKNRQRRPLNALHRVTLSQLLRAHLFAQSGYQDLVATSPVLGPGFSIAPLHERHQRSALVINQGFPRKQTAILIADVRDPLSHEPDFDILFEATILRSVVICDRVIVVTNMTLPSFDSTLAVMKPELRAIIHIERCDLDIDVTLPARDERFDTLVEYLEKHTVRPA